MGIRSKIAGVLRTTVNVRRALTYVWESSSAWTIANALLLVVQGLLPIASLYLLKLLIDSVTAVAMEPQSSGGLPREIMVVLAAAAVVALLNALSRTFGMVVNKEQARRVADHMHDVIQKKAVDVDLQYYENPAYQDSLHRAQEESTFRPGAIMGALTRVFQNLISLCGVAWLLLTFHWAVFLVLVVALLPAVIVRFVFSHREYLRERAYTNKERHAAYYHWMLVTRDFAKEIRMFGLGPTFIRRFQNLRSELRKIRLSLDLKSAGFSSVANVISIVLVFGAYAWVARDAVMGTVTIGGFVLFYQAFQRGQTFLSSLLEGLASLFENNLFLENLYEYLDLPAGMAAQKGTAAAVQEKRASVVFEDIWFRYPGTETDVLKGIDLRIEAGQVAALVGLNGVGKTTLVKLLCRLYDVDSGRILVDGADIRSFEPDVLRHRVGVVFQDYAQYNLTASDNIWFGDVAREKDASAIQAAATKAGIHDVLSTLEQGYESVLGRLFEHGKELSIGQWQKVALARAFFRDTGLIVLDEPTSAMDPKAEYELFNRFRAILDGRSALLISHRMSTVRMADVIFVMDNGRIAEYGPHEHLMKSDGIYRDLFETQAQSYLAIDT